MIIAFPSIMRVAKLMNCSLITNNTGFFCHGPVNSDPESCQFILAMLKAVECEHSFPQQHIIGLLIEHTIFLC